jgi:hypothetical protein
VSRSQVAAFTGRLINSKRRASSAAFRSSGAPRSTFALRDEFFRRGIPILAKHTGPLTPGTVYQTICIRPRERREFDG